jgi:hypothetical protein
VTPTPEHALENPKDEPRASTQGEWLFVAVWVLLVVSAVGFPIWHGYQQTPPGWDFLGFIGPYHHDYNSYLAWIRQAEDGHLLFRQMFTSEPHSRVFFHPLFWLVGTLARSTELPSLAAWYAAELLACGFLVVAIYRFSCEFSNRSDVRFLALVLATTASGLGWLVRPQGAYGPTVAIDLWMSEANQFLAMITSFFTLTVSLALMLTAMVHFLRHLRTGRPREAWVTGLYGLALCATHQYDALVLFGVLGAWTWLAGPRFYAGFIAAAVPSLPFGLYSLALLFFDPVFSRLAWDMPVPTPTAHLLGYGLPLALALLALVLPGVRRDNRNVPQLGAWLLVAGVLLLLPLGFERKLIWGAHVAICVLAAMSTVFCLERATSRFEAASRRRMLVGAGGVAVALVCSIGSIQFYGLLLDRSRGHQWFDYLPGPYLEAIAWLDRNAQPGEVVLAAPKLAAMLPGRAGTTVFLGHWAQTVEATAKEEVVAQLLGPPRGADLQELSRLLERNRVRYIVADVATAQMYGRSNIRTGFAFERLAKLAFGNQAVTIWRLDSGGGSETEPWPDGDWRGAGSNLPSGSPGRRRPQPRRPALLRPPRRRGPRRREDGSSCARAARCCA